MKFSGLKTLAFFHLPQLTQSQRLAISVLHPLNFQLAVPNYAHILLIAFVPFIFLHYLSITLARIRFPLFFSVTIFSVFFPHFFSITVHLFLSCSLISFSVTIVPVFFPHFFSITLVPVLFPNFLFNYTCFCPLSSFTF